MTSEKETFDPEEKVEFTDPTQKFEEFLVAVEKGEKSSYLTANYLYITVKKTVVEAPISKKLFEQAVTGIGKVAAFLNDKTNAGITVFDLDRSYDLLNNLDELMKDQSIKADDGFDTLRADLVAKLRALVSSVQEQTKLIKNKADEARNYSTTVIGHVKTHYQKAIERLTAFLLSVKEKYPKTFSTIENGLDNVQVGVRESVHKTQNRINEATTYVLTTAQPYVQTAVKTTKPYVVQAVEYTQPYVEKYQNYLTPIVAKATDVNKQLIESTYIGPYYTYALNTAFDVFEETKHYCAIESQ